MRSAFFRWISCSMFRVVLFSLTLLGGPAGATMLQGEQRSEMIKSSAGSCLDSNIKKAENRPYTLAVVDAFCTCVGTSVVDGFTLEELGAAGNKMTPEFEKRRDAMAAKCSASTFGKARPQ